MDLKRSQADHLPIHASQLMTILQDFSGVETSPDYFESLASRLAKLPDLAYMSIKLFRKRIEDPALKLLYVCI